MVNALCVRFPYVFKAFLARNGSILKVFGLFAWVILMFLASLFASIFLRPPKEETDKARELGAYWRRSSPICRP